MKNFFSVTGRKEVAVNVIEQDSLGFLWIGTTEGVYRFDGITAERPSPDPVGEQEVTALKIAAGGIVWMGTRNGKIYTLKDGKADSIRPKAANKSKITAFAELQSGMCIGTYGNGIYTVRNGAVGHFSSAQGLSDDVVYTLAVDGKNTVWAGTDAGITQITNIFAHPRLLIISDKHGLPDNIVRDVDYAGNNKLLIAMQDSGVCYYNLTRQSFERMSFFDNWSLGTVLHVESQGPGKLLIATERNGLLQIDRGAFYIYKYDDYQIPSARYMFVDNTYQVWIASKSGLSRFSEKRYTFIDRSQGLEEMKVLALTTDNDKAIWIGTTTGISKIVTDDLGKLVVTRIQDLSRYTISCATRAPDGDIWFGTYGNGIIILSSVTKASVILNSHEDRLINDNISSIFFADEHTAYISTLGGGLMKVSVELGEKEKSFAVDTTFTEEYGLGSNYVYMAIADSAGRLYIATDGGGLQLLEKGRFTDLTKKFKVPSNTIYSLCLDRGGNLWAISNSAGVLRYDGRELRTVNRASGLRDEQPQQIVASGDIVYAIHSKGIDKIDRNTLEVTYYDVTDSDLEPNLNAVFISDGKLYSGTNKGILVYRTNQERLDSLKPTVYLKSLQLNFKPFPLDSINEFSHNQNNFAFRFGGIWLRNPDKLFFRYRLFGLEESWNFSNEGKVVNYNNLNPGHYKLVVQSRNEEDVWGDPVEYPFVITPPVWMRWWFWVVTLLVVTAGVYSLVRYRLRSLQRENLLLERRVRERTFQIEKQSRIIEEKNLELEKLSLVASKTDNVVVILDPSGKLEYINESYFKMHRLTMDDLRQNYGDTIFDVSNHPDIREIINDAVANKRSVNYESLNRKSANGGEVWESSTLTPIFDENGALKKIIIIDTDVSVRKRQEQVIIQKNKDITDSISYARKIQHAILPNLSVIHEHLPNCFVLYLTKDIVSGDFFWFSHFGKHSIIAAVDCTGHGVPGAFMSLIGYNLLNRIVNEKHITAPHDILVELNTGVINALYKNESESKDGMDIAICKINHEEGTMEFAGAMRPLWTVYEGKLSEIKADKIPIGTRPRDRNVPIAYHTHKLTLRKGETYYIFTDGYADQFGGTKDKKYSTGRFKDLLINCSTHPIPEQEEMIRSEHLTWKGDNEQIDDILVIGFQV